MAKTLPKAVWILCLEHGLEAMEPNSQIFLAKFGPQGIDPEDVAVLIAPTLAQCRPEKILKAKNFPCDECGAKLYVHESSQWLLDMRDKLEKRGR